MFGCKNSFHSFVNCLNFWMFKQQKNVKHFKASLRKNVLQEILQSYKYTIIVKN